MNIQNEQDYREFIQALSDLVQEAIENEKQ